MVQDPQTPITRLLADAARGDRQAAADLLPLVYEELRRLARARLAREAPGQTLQPTALVHDAYLRLVGDHDPGWDNRGHFFAAAALAMRRILVEQARGKARLRHGAAFDRAPLDPNGLAAAPADEDALAVDEAVRTLEANDPRKGQIVNLRYFAGLTTEETAAALGVSVGTVEREWRFIRAWLQRALAGPGGG